MSNDKGSNRRRKKDKNEISKKQPLKEIKIPIDFKIFWKSLDENYFKHNDSFTYNEVNHVIKSLSKYGKNINLYLFSN